MGMRYSFPPFAAALLVVSGCAGIEPFRNVACFEAAKVSLKSAVALAEQQGGQAIDAAYRQDRELGCLQMDPGVYDVTLLSGNDLRVVSVDAKSGEVGSRKTDDSKPDFGIHDVLEKVATGGRAPKPDIVPELAITITQATDIAERDGGKAMVAWADTNDSEPGYRVKLVENGKTRTAWVGGGLAVFRAQMKALAPRLKRRS
jgi:hypothetical protein